MCNCAQACPTPGNCPRQGRTAHPFIAGGHPEAPGKAPPEQSSTLAGCAAGCPRRIVAIAGDDALRLRLADLGLFPEQVVVKKGAQFWRGPVLVRLPGGAELALGQRLAAQVAVREEELPPPAACPAPLISASAAS